MRTHKGLDRVEEMNRRETSKNEGKKDDPLTMSVQIGLERSGTRSLPYGLLYVKPV